ncbi:MAG TPA: MFS transporter [Xanthobacteraceae bacterium]|nr:MFS transporter [Xanthobacteraceae bacterium]
MDAGPIKPEQTAGPQLGTGLTLAILSIAGFAIGANIRITDPLLPTFASEFSTTVGAAALVAMFYALAHGALQIVYGPLGDRVGKLPVITVAALGSAVISAATALATSLAGLAALRLLSGVATAAIVPLTLAFIGDTTTYAQRHVALARFTGTVLLGLMCGQVLGGLIAEFLGWRAVFYFIAAVFAVAGIGLLLSPALRNHERPARRSSREAYAELFSLFKRPAVRHVLLAVCAQGGISFTSAAFVGAHLHDRFGFSLGMIGVMLGLFAAGGIVYSFVTARVLATFGERGTLMLGGVMFGLSFLAIAVTPYWQVFGPALFVAGIGLMMVHNMLQVGATQMAPEARGAALSLFAAMIFLGQTIGFAVLSPTYDHFGGVPIFVFTAIAFPIIAFGFRSTLAKR